MPSPTDAALLQLLIDAQDHPIGHCIRTDSPLTSLRAKLYTLMRAHAITDIKLTIPDEKGSELWLVKKT